MTVRYFIRLTGVRLFRAFLAVKAQLTGNAVEQTLRRVGERIARDAAKNFQGERTRAKFVPSRKGRRRRKRPRGVSSPPDKLGSFTGQLRRSIGVRVEKSGFKVAVLVGPRARVKYAAVHELGYAPLHIPKRPFLTPAFDKNKAWAERQLQRKINLVLR